MNNAAANVEALDAAEVEIAICLSLEKPVSFFLFAGAGSGKTRALVGALRNIKASHGRTLQLRSQQIAVITYTNAARDEIDRRLDFDPLLIVSTIHTFVWELIKGFNADIRSWLRENLTAEIAGLQADQLKGKPASQAYADRARKIASTSERLQALAVIKQFKYSPTGDNRTRDSLSHAEVIKISAAFLNTKPLMRELLVRKYPFLLIDESQDTNKGLIDAFFAVQTAHKDCFCLGLFGDTMQRIYADGKRTLGESLPADWKRPAKTINYRCPRRVVDLINRIRLQVDPHVQEPKAGASEGVVRFFIAPNDGSNRTACEQRVREHMAEITGDPSWSQSGKVKALTLEHKMAAKRLGFLDLFTSLDAVSDFTTGLRDGTLPALTFFSQLILPLVRAGEQMDKFKIAAIVRRHSPLLSAQNLVAGNDQEAQIAKAREAVESLQGLFKDGADPTFQEVLTSVGQSGLFNIPESLKPFAGGDLPVADAAANQEDDESTATKRLASIRQFLGGRFSPIEAYSLYIDSKTELSTHQGVKGLEFPRVLVIMDDSEAGGFLFSYEKLFGAKELSTTDVKNQENGDETGIDRTRRLFYVTCSRAELSLALIAYSANPAKVQQGLLKQNWFKPEEIILFG